MHIEDPTQLLEGEPPVVVEVQNPETLNYWLAVVKKVTSHELTLEWLGMEGPEATFTLRSDEEAHNAERDLGIHPYGWCKQNKKIRRHPAGARDIPQGQKLTVWRPKEPEPMRSGTEVEALNPSNLFEWVSAKTMWTCERLTLIKFKADGSLFLGSVYSMQVRPIGFARCLALPDGEISQFEEKTSHLRGKINPKFSKKEHFSAFKVQQKTLDNLDLIRIGMKMEVVDQRDYNSFAVGTIVVNSENGLVVVKLETSNEENSLQHFVLGSGYCLPPNFCRDNGLELNPPPGYEKEDFSWEAYLRDTNSQPVPDVFFPDTVAKIWQVGSAVEAVRQSGGLLVEQAVIREVCGNLLKIEFENTSQWYDRSSPYIKQVGWSHRHEREVDLLRKMIERV